MYHFKECGLDYVWLRNGFDYKDTPRGQFVRIHDIDGLHAAIARWIVTNPSRLRGQEVRFLRSMLRLSQDGLARALGRTRASVARWEADGERSLPEAADRALRMFYALRATGHEVACRIVELLTELDELENGNATREAKFTEETGWRAAA